MVFDYLENKRIELGLTKTAAAARCQVSASAYAAWSNGAYLVQSLRNPEKSSVIKGIQRLTGDDIPTITHEIEQYLIKTGKLSFSSGCLEDELEKLISNYERGTIRTRLNPFDNSKSKDLILLELKHAYQMVNKLSELK